MDHVSPRLGICKLLIPFFILLVFVRHIEASTAVSTARPVIISGTYGGLGNQLYYLCENLLFARQGNFTFIPPSISVLHSRNENITVPLPDVEYDEFLDSRFLTRIVNISRTLPKHCGGHVQHVFVGRRHGNLAVEIPRFTAAARLLVSHNSSETDESRNKRFVENAKVHKRFLPMEHGANYSYVREVSFLSGSCVFLDGHSFFRKGADDLEYLYSFMHYVESAPRVKRLADQWNTDNLCVLHLRYDEHECVPDVERMKGKICIRRKLKMAPKGTVMWIDTNILAKVVVKAMKQKKASSLYLATSPYVPAESRAQLISHLSKRVKVEPVVPEEVGSMVKNFVEREIAIRAKLFIGDFASTWSGTLYYKRRTMGRETDWTCSLLGKCSDLAFYGRKGKLKSPQWFEKNFDVRPTADRLK